MDMSLYVHCFQPKIAGIKKRWRSTTTREQDNDVHCKPASKWCFSLRCAPKAFYSMCCLNSNSNFPLLATYFTVMTNIGLDASRQIAVRIPAQSRGRAPHLKISSYVYCSAHERSNSTVDQPLLVVFEIPLEILYMPYLLRIRLFFLFRHIIRFSYLY